MESDQPRINSSTGSVDGTIRRDFRDRDRSQDRLFINFFRETSYLGCNGIQLRFIEARLLRSATTQTYQEFIASVQNVLRAVIEGALNNYTAS